MSLFKIAKIVLFGRPFCARNLRRRTIIKIDGESVTVASIERCDGKDGRPHHLILLNGKTAVGLLIKFFERAPIVVHPGKEMSRVSIPNT